MKAKYAYPAIFNKNDKGYFVSFPDIRPCFTEGSTLEEAVVMAKGVLEGRIEIALEDGETLPVPSDINSLCGDHVMLIVAAIKNTERHTPLAWRFYHHLVG